jgi:hypothetical protein
MDQQVISNIKKRHTKALFQMCFEVTSDTELTLRDFWKHNFNILHSLTLIDKAWQQVTYRTMNSVRRKLWPDCVAGRDFEGFDTENFAVVDDIVSLGKNMGLEINNDDVEELLQDHKTHHSMVELKELQEQQLKMIVEEMSSDEEDGSKDVFSSLIREICAKWGEVQSFLKRYHPVKAVASCSINIFNDNAMFHFRKF